MTYPVDDRGLGAMFPAMLLVVGGPGTGGEHGRDLGGPLDWPPTPAEIPGNWCCWALELRCFRWSGKNTLQTQFLFPWICNFYAMHLTQAYKFDILKKRKRKKTHNSRKKLNNSSEKLKDLTKFTERRKKLKYFCCKNTFYQKSIAFSYKKLFCLQ